MANIKPQSKYKGVIRYTLYRSAKSVKQVPIITIDYLSETIDECVERFEREVKKIKKMNARKLEGLGITKSDLVYLNINESEIDNLKKEIVQKRNIAIKKVIDDNKLRINELKNENTELNARLKSWRNQPQ